MNPLDLLKTQLQNALNESTESEDFNDALSDAIYGCDLSIKALETWMMSWIAPNYLEYISYEQNQYIQGVKFVEDKWYQITGMF